MTWSPPISHFIHFLVNQLQDQPLFQEKKIDRGTPIEGFQEYFKATPPKKKREKVVKTPQFRPPPQKKGGKIVETTHFWPPIIQGTDHAIDIYIYNNLIKTTKYSMFIYINILQVIKTWNQKKLHCKHLCHHLIWNKERNYKVI